MLLPMGTLFAHQLLNVARRAQFCNQTAFCLKQPFTLQLYTFVVEGRLRVVPLMLYSEGPDAAAPEAPAHSRAVHSLLRLTRSKGLQCHVVSARVEHNKNSRSKTNGEEVAPT